MPADGEEIRVRTGTSSEQPWSVTNLGRCSDYTDGKGERHEGCGVPIFWCVTPNNHKAPVDTIPDDEGRYTSHHATCYKRIDERRKAVQGRLAVEDPPPQSGRDRAAGR
jgi:hypothetical protein